MNSASATLRDFLTSARWYQLVVVVGTLFLSCFAISGLMNEDQPLVIVIFFLGVLAIPTAVMNPRWGLITFLWLAHSIDGVKRIVYHFTNFTQVEIAKILIVPVLVMGALYVRVFFLSWFGTGIVARVVLKRFWPLVLACAGAFAFTIRGGLSFDSLAANYTLLCYIPAGFIVPHIIFNTERRLAYVKALIIIAVVLGVYGLTQTVHGPFDYEYEYMMSGLTITVGSIEGQAYFRAFSLMNNGPTFCGTMVMITLLSYFYFCRNEGRLRMKKSVVAMTLFTIVCCFGATQRGPLVSFLFTLCLLPLCTRPRAFFVALGFGLLAFAGLVYFANEMMGLMWIANDAMVSSTDSAFLRQNATIVTYGQRLNGFAALSDPALWTPFGISSRMGSVSFMANGLAGSHDLISNFLEWFGYIGTAAFLGFCSVFVYRVIMRVQDMLKTPERAMWAQCNLAVFLFMMIWQIFSGPTLNISPLQFYFWVAIGNVLYLLTEPAPEPVEDASESPSGIWRPRTATREPVLRHSM